MSDKESERKRRLSVRRIRSAVPKGFHLRSPDLRQEDRDASQFVERARKALGLTSNHVFDSGDLRSAAMLFRLAPIRLIQESQVGTLRMGKGKWFLHLRQLDASTVAYDPEKGVRQLKLEAGLHTVFTFMFNSEDEAQWGEVGVDKGKILNLPPDVSYSIPEEPLRGLSRMRGKMRDSGLLCLFAAKFARGE